MNGSETLRARVQDLAFAGTAITVRDGKGMRPQPERRATTISSQALWKRRCDCPSPIANISEAPVSETEGFRVYRSI